ncbi:MAG TPA: D-2-hydroxyacid dehydrogenase [Stellaceae bacterium]|jgi:phosphoglycerate dehydrogenase-like enzyme|nr:D-2-hydroxyacid dehydrogenase [Stellaceae bacterium]
MTKVLIYLTMLPPAECKRCCEFVRAEFPALDVALVETLADVDPHIGDAEILITFGAHLGQDADSILGRGKKLRWVMALGTGVDHITDVPALRPEAMVTNMHGMHGVPMTEAALSLMLALAREMPRMLRQQQQHHWERYGSRLLFGKTVGIFGIGAIAAVLGPVCKAFGMKVIGITTGKRELAGFDRMVHRDALAQVIGELDHFVILTPLTDETRNIVDASMLAAMKPSAFLINLARGGIVDEAALIDALKARRIGGAAIDVFVKEPLPPDHPFWAMDNVILSPHIGAFNADYISQVLPFVKENLTRYLAGDHGRMINVVRKGATHG